MATAWRQEFESPSRDHHLVQLYADAGVLPETVSAWIRPSLARGGGAVLLATPNHGALVREALAAEQMDVDQLQAEGRLVVLAANDVLGQLMVDGLPDAARFQSVVPKAIAGVREVVGEAGDIRAWGEMVNILWNRGDLPAARRLEDLWNDLLRHQPALRLLCSYEMDRLDPAMHLGPLQSAARGHTRLISGPDDARFDLAVSQALTDMFGEDEARNLQALFVARQESAARMASGDAVLAGLHDLLPELGTRVLLRARRHFEAQRQFTRNARWHQGTRMQRA